MENKIYLWRQIFILITGMLYSISVGYVLAFPAVLNPAILSNSTDDIHATPDQASWISTSNGIGGIFGYFILSPIFQIFGRKIVHIFTNLCLLIGWIIFSFAHSISALIVARVIQGFVIGGIYIQSMIMCEYSDPRRRGYFITIKKMGLSIGIIMCHASSLIWNWRQISNMVIILSVMPLIMTFFWPESPAFLAMKGRFEESEKSFVWLHGGSNMQELDVLLSAQRKKLNNPSTEKWYNWHKALFKKDFLKPFVIVSILSLIVDLGGKFYIGAYVIEIMVELLGDKSMAVYCSLGADFLTIVALVSCCLIIRHVKRRTILFSFGFFAVFLMLLISLIIYFKLTIVPWLSPAIILLQVFTVNISLIPLSFAFVGEIFPLEHKGNGSFMTGIVFTIFYTLTLKVTSILMKNTGVEGIYAIYGVSMALCLFVLYFMVPETKDRTLQDIEDELKCIEPIRDNENSLLS